MENQVDTTTKITQQSRILKIDVGNSPYKNSMDTEIASSYNGWVEEFNSQPTMLYLGWKTALALLIQNQDSLVAFSNNEPTIYSGMKICVVQDPWHLELGFGNIEAAIMANTIRAYKAAPGEEVENV